MFMVISSPWPGAGTSAGEYCQLPPDLLPRRYSYLSWGLLAVIFAGSLTLTAATVWGGESVAMSDRRSGQRCLAMPQTASRPGSLPGRLSLPEGVRKLLAALGHCAGLQATRTVSSLPVVLRNRTGVLN